VPFQLDRQIKPVAAAFMAAQAEACGYQGFFYWNHRGNKLERHQLVGSLPEGKRAYCMFNNSAMLNDAKRFVRMINSAR